MSWSGFTLGAGAVLDLKRFNGAFSGGVGSATGGGGESLMLMTSRPHGRHLETRRQRLSQVFSPILGHKVKKSFW